MKVLTDLKINIGMYRPFVMVRSTRNYHPRSLVEVCSNHNVYKNFLSFHVPYRAGTDCRQLLQPLALLKVLWVVFWFCKYLVLFSKILFLCLLRLKNYCTHFASPFFSVFIGILLVLYFIALLYCFFWQRYFLSFTFPLL